MANRSLPPFQGLDGRQRCLPGVQRFSSSLEKGRHQNGLPAGIQFLVLLRLQLIVCEGLGAHSLSSSPVCVFQASWSEVVESLIFLSIRNFRNDIRKKM